MFCKRLNLFAGLLLCMLWAATACAQTQAPLSGHPSVKLTANAQFPFPADHIHELSGIDYLSEDRYLLVSDKGGAVSDATIRIDPETGAITSAQIGKKIHRLQGRKDVEAVTYTSQNRLLVTDEARPGIYLHDYETGAQLAAFNLPDAFKRQRNNRGFESLSLTHHGGGAIWAANEEALKGDGPTSSGKTGTIVRLQRYNPDLSGEPTAQFAYQTDPHRGADNLINQALAGVSGVVALDPHRLIILERELGGSGVPSFRNRLYLVDTRGAQDTSKIDSLSETPVEPVKKLLLLEIDAKFSNFEGITLGPKLDNGDYVLVLVSDDSGGNEYTPQNLMTVRVSADIIEGSKTRAPSKSATDKPR